MDPVPPLTLVVEKFSRIAVCFFCFFNFFTFCVNLTKVELCPCVGFGVVVAVDV